MYSGAQKAGGGTQGREIKSKSTKNKYKGRGGTGRDSDEEGDNVMMMAGGARGSGSGWALEFMGVEEMVDVLNKYTELEETPKGVREEIAARLYRYSMLRLKHSLTIYYTSLMA